MEMDTVFVDGSSGEGGGQMLRTSVALSALTGLPVEVDNIRAGRPNPGLRPQHLAAVKAVAELCGASVKGLAVGSRTVSFRPGGIKSRKIRIDIGTAGSASLVLQALMIPAMRVEDEVRIQVLGGTDVRWSPSFDYMDKVLLPLLRGFGYDADLKLMHRGYYPGGGGRIELSVRPMQIAPIRLTGRGRIESVGGLSHAHVGLSQAKVAERQTSAARLLLYNKLANANYSGEIKIDEDYNSSFSYGSGICLWAKTEKSLLGSDAVGEKGKRAEAVGIEAAESLVEDLSTGAAVDRHMADQIIPYLAVAGGRVDAARITSHAKTHAEITRLFGLDVKIEGNTLWSRGV